MTETLVISAFPATGKTYFTENCNSGIKVLDSDSSKFSWLLDKNGQTTKERNPVFPKNYIEHIKNNIGKVDIIFVSSHDLVRNALVENDIKFLLFYPNTECLKEYVGRFENRGNEQSFIDFISKNWVSFIAACQDQKGCVKIGMKDYQYLSDLISVA